VISNLNLKLLIVTLKKFALLITRPHKSTPLIMLQLQHLRIELILKPTSITHLILFKPITSHIQMPKTTSSKKENAIRREVWLLNGYRKRTSLADQVLGSPKIVAEN